MRCVECKCAKQVRKMGGTRGEVEGEGGGKVHSIKTKKKRNVTYHIDDLALLPLLRDHDRVPLPLLTDQVLSQAAQADQPSADGVHRVLPVLLPVLFLILVVAAAASSPVGAYAGTCVVRGQVDRVVFAAGSRAIVLGFVGSFGVGGGRRCARVVVVVRAQQGSFGLLAPGS